MSKKRIELIAREGGVIEIRVGDNGDPIAESYDELSKALSLDNYLRHGLNSDEIASLVFSYFAQMEGVEIEVVS